MASEMTATHAAAIRMTNQGLTHRPARDARTAAIACAGIQAQDLWASRLAVRARSSTAVVGDVVNATHAPATIVRSWLMRGTLHLVAADQARALVRLIGPAVLKMAKPRWAEVGLTEPLRDQASEVLPDVLCGRALTRSALVAALRERGVAVPAEGQGPAHLTVWASAAAIICRGGDEGSEPTYVLLDEWLPGPASTGPAEDDLRTLVRSYLRSFGPATVEDFAAWSRLLISAARPAFAELGEELTIVTIDERPHYLLGHAEAARDVLRLLPAFDSYLMGYRHRDHFLDPARRGLVAVGGIIYPTIVVDGVIVGTWRLDRARDPLRLRAEYFRTPSRRERDALAAEAEDVGRFLGRACDLTMAHVR